MSVRRASDGKIYGSNNDPGYWIPGGGSGGKIRPDPSGMPSASSGGGGGGVGLQARSNDPIRSDDPERSDDPIRSDDPEGWSGNIPVYAKGGPVIKASYKGTGPVEAGSWTAPMKSRGAR